MHIEHHAIIEVSRVKRKDRSTHASDFVMECRQFLQAFNNIKWGCLDGQQTLSI